MMTNRTDRMPIKIPTRNEDEAPATWCIHYRLLDAKFGTTLASPLHHDNRCRNHG